MRKDVVGATFYTAGSMTVLGITLMMSVDAAAYLLAMQVVGIGPDTPVSGVTLAMIFAGIVGGGGGLIYGAKLLFKFGGYVQDLETTLKGAAGLASIVHEIDNRVATVERWRTTIADPCLSRSGFRNPDAIDSIQKLYDAEAAG